MAKRYEGNGRLALVVEHNGILYFTGRTCMNAGSNIHEQTDGVLKIIDETLNKYGSDKRHILRVQIFLKDIIRDFDGMNEVWESYIEKGFEPARATVQAKMAKEEALVEMVVTAMVKDPKESV